MRQIPLAFLPARSPHLETAFYSPAATVLFRKPPQRGQTLPAYLFGAILNSSSSPFGLLLPPSVAFITPPGMFVAQSPLPSRELKTLKHPSNFRSPSGLSSLWIVALSQRLGLRSLPWYPARFPFAPRKRQLPFNNYPLSDHRSGFATVHQAYCSLNLLEPCP